MQKRFTLFALILLMIGQTILAPLSTVSIVSAQNSDVDVEEAGVENENETLVVEVDKTELEDLLEKSKEFEEELYTETSFNKFTEAVEDGEEIYEKDDATEKEVEKAIEEIEESIEQLEKLEEKEEETQTEDENASAEENHSDVTKDENEKEEEVVQSKEEEKNNKEEEGEQPLSVTTNAEEGDVSPLAEKTGFHFSISRILAYDQSEIGEDNPLKISSDFYVEYAWYFDNDHTYEAGDSVSFNIPSQLKIEQEMTGKIDFEGEKMADYVIATDGTITLTFTSLITELSDVSGTLWILSELDETKIEIEDGQIIIDPIEDEDVIRIPVITEDQEASITKKGTPIPPFSPNEIKWTIEVNTQQTKHTDGIIKDVLPTGLEYKFGTLKIDGNDANDPNIDGQTLSIEVGEFTGKKTIEFITNINDEDMESFENIANFESNQTEEISASASVGIKRGKPLEKLSGHYDPVTRTIEWTINLNFDNKGAASQVLSDAWDIDMTLVDDSISLNEVELDEGGNPKPTDKTESFTILESSNSGFKLEIPTLDGPYQLKYKTKLADRVVSDKIKVKNTVNWNGKDDPAEIEVHPSLGWKGHNVNYSHKTIDWTVAYNTDKQKMTNTVIKDPIQTGMELTDESDIHVYNPETGEAVSNAEIDYNAETKTITVNIPGEIDHEIRLSYKVSYDYRELEGLDDKKFSNTAYIDWDENPDDDPQEVTSEFWPNKETEVDGAKWGSYAPESKEITWSVLVNYQQNEHDQLVVTDELEGNQQLVTDSIKVYEVELNQEGKEASRKHLENAAIDITDAGFDVNLGSTSKTHLIEYKTSLEGLSDIAKQYKNIAFVKSGDKDVTKLPATVDIVNGNNYVHKTGAQNGSLIDWSVTVNATQATLKNVVLTDIVNDDQEFIESSVKVYTTKPGTTEKAEELSSDKYSVDITGEESQVLTLKFKEEINRAYIVEYSTIYFAGHQEEVENTVKITASNITEEDGYETGGKVTIVQTSGGSGTGQVGYLKVEKISNDGSPLEGVTFKLLDKDGQELRVGTSDEDGLIDFKRLRYGKYELVEVETVDGYIKLKDPVEVEINKPYNVDDPESIQTIEVVNDKEVKAIKIIKVDKETEEHLDGAEFKMQTGK